MTQLSLIPPGLTGAYLFAPYVQTAVISSPNSASKKGTPVVIKETKLFGQRTRDFEVARKEKVSRLCWARSLRVIP